ncbi:hypothetical protein OT109_17280 [Phycisphaeraceae bacterium D3-23]
MIEEFAEENDVDIRFETIVVRNELDVQAYRYLGSPSVRINGLDVDPRARSSRQYGFG